MTSYFDTTIGQHEQLDRLLAQAGMTHEDVKDILAKPELASKMVASLRTVSVPGWASPAWYVSPERQLERVKQLNEQQEWGFSESDFPSISENFVPRTSTEVLLLAVYLPEKGKQTGLRRTFNELWRFIVPPCGYSKVNSIGNMRLVPGYKHQPGIRWIAFDPNAYHKLSPENALTQAKADKLRLAGTEVLMAALLFPDWATSWNGEGSPYPNLSGLQSKLGTGWSSVPCLDRWDDDRRLGLSANGAVRADDDWSSPSVREC